MRSRWTAALTVFAMLVAAPQLAAAAEVEAQLESMEQRMQAMEDRLQATNDQLEAANDRVEEQSELIEQAGLAETRGTSSGLPGFLGEITVGGWVAASYFYNLNRPEDNNDSQYVGFFCEADCDTDDELIFPVSSGDGMGGTNQGANGAFYPLHPDANSFALDQVWFEIERPIDEEHRAGFRLDTVYGKTGAVANGFGGPSNRYFGNDDSSIYVHQGYVQYLAPIANGITFRAGKFATPIGVEVLGTVYNWNITRGNVWNLLQPIDHIGATVGGNVGDSGFDWMLGIANGFSPNDPDINEAKNAIWHFGWTGETVSASINGTWGGNKVGFDGNESGVLDGIVQWNPTDQLGLYVNGDWAWSADSGHPGAWGVSVGGRYGFTDRTGFAIRGEYLADYGQYFGFIGWNGSDVMPVYADNGAFNNGWQDTGVEIWGITGTLDHLLTDHLMIRAEVRYDNVSKDSTRDKEFIGNGFSFGKQDLGLDSNQLTVGAEVVYNFNKFGGE